MVHHLLHGIALLVLALLACVLQCLIWVYTVSHCPFLVVKALDRTLFPYFAQGALGPRTNMECQVDMPGYHCLRRRDTKRIDLSAMAQCGLYLYAVCITQNTYVKK